MTPHPDLEGEVVDDHNGLVLRRVTVGPLATNCLVVFPTTPPRHAILVDPGDEPTRVVAACEDVQVTAIVLTHEHWDHVLALPDVADALGAPVLAHDAEHRVWAHECRHLASHGHFDAGTATSQLLAAGHHLAAPDDRTLWDGTTTPVHHGDRIHLGDLAIEVLHTPGHTPGSISLRLPGHLLSGDTLFPGGPGLTGWPLSDFDTIIRSIRTQLFTLPQNTSVHPGHGPSTTIGTELPHLPTWIARGW